MLQIRNLCVVCMNAGGAPATWISRRNMGRRLSTGFTLLIAVLVAGSLGPSAEAQPSPERATSASTSRAPSPADALRAHALVHGWIRTWVDPPSAESTEALSAMVSGVCVTLRLPDGGVARGTAWHTPGAPEADADPARRTLALLQRAARDAMMDAEPKLNAPNDARREESLRVLGGQIAVSVELAGPLGVIEPETWEDVEIALRPGLDGVGVRRLAASGFGGSLHAVFPSQMMLANQLPHRALGRAVAEALGEGGAAAALEKPIQIRSSHGLRMLAFRVAHAGQSSPEQPAIVLYRGQRLVPAGSVLTRGELRAMADRMAQHLVRRAVRSTVRDARGDELVVRTVRQTVIGAGAESQESSPTTDAIVMLALCRANQSRPDAEIAAAARELHRGVRAGIARRENDHAVALALSRSIEHFGLSLGDEPSATERDEPLSNALRAAAGGTTNPVLSDQRAVGFVAVFARLQTPGLEGERLARAIEDHRLSLEKIILPALAANRPETVASAMPSLGWGVLSLADARRADRVARRTMPAATRTTEEPREGEDVAGAVMLRRMRELCWEHQITITTAGEDALDMIGGIVLTRPATAGTSGTPYPTWQCVRPLGFVASMLADVRLTDPAERNAEIVKLLSAMRFIRQLEVDDASAWMYPVPALAMGGIRSAPWDQQISAEATALALLSVLEAIDALDGIAAERSGRPATGTPEAPLRWFEHGVLRAVREASAKP